MNRDQYIEMFEQVGFYCQDRYGNQHPVATAYNTGRRLRHRPVDLPTIYFNGNEHGVYFVVKVEDSIHFSTLPWGRIDPQKPSDDTPTFMTLVPRAGRERQAFDELV